MPPPSSHFPVQVNPTFNRSRSQLFSRTQSSNPERAAQATLSVTRDDGFHFGFLLVFLVSFGFLVFWFLLVSFGFFWFLLVSFGFFWFLLVFSFFPFSFFFFPFSFSFLFFPFSFFLFPFSSFLFPFFVSPSRGSGSATNGKKRALDFY